jgi:hypothetical protein
VASKSKRQQTAAKRTREHAVREKRELKQQKRLAAAADKRMREADPSITLPVREDAEVGDELADGNDSVD